MVTLTSALASVLFATKARRMTAAANDVPQRPEKKPVYGPAIWLARSPLDAELQKILGGCVVRVIEQYRLEVAAILEKP